MSRATLYITNLLPEPVMAVLRDRYTLAFEPSETQFPTNDDRRQGFAQADAVICTLADPITDDLLAEAPRLKIVANYAVGYNNIDVAAATRRGIVVTNTPDVLTDATADLTWALILAVARRVVEGDRWARSGTWPGWAPTQMLGTDVSGKHWASSAWDESVRPSHYAHRGFACRCSMPVVGPAPVHPVSQPGFTNHWRKC